MLKKFAEKGETKKALKHLEKEVGNSSDELKY